MGGSNPGDCRMEGSFQGLNIFLLMVTEVYIANGHLSIKRCTGLIIRNMSPILDVKTNHETCGLRTGPFPVNLKSPYGIICPQSALFFCYHHRARA